MIEKDISLGLEGTLCSEMRSAFCGEESPEMSSFIMGLGGRDITVEEIMQIARDLAGEPSLPGGVPHPSPGFVEGG